ncbi:GNAT family N-acetyltransferase [Halocynthiibacter styelae]|uniref:GNAT family N-acetyltransferase n=1 Tax=Halocynthiibacter styelae TaxID=2761955 RepID=A0A8J7IKZ7_9RHOB|nr:GNAT family N-acetyltransferase [Paenihalocynthiibacter styelae]MBI1495173.1 GNAT family N-acetyltransferase [Paenihalocynthiibacter styelae]
MSQPDVFALYDVCENTWPAKAVTEENGWSIRDGAGGGQRVSAATAVNPGEVPDIAEAEAAMDALGQNPLFMIREGEDALDQALETRGYKVKDPVTLWLAEIDEIASEDAPRMSAFTVWPPVGIMEELWVEGGIGPARLDVMHRGCDPKTGIFGRTNDRPAGVAYVGIHNGIAMLHALEVTPSQRRNGSAGRILRKAATWAKHHGAKHFSVIVTQENQGANALYSSLNMRSVGQYHYRVKPVEA